MSFRVHDKHWEIIVNFMEEHPEVATGKFVGPSAGFGERSVEKWQKTWTDNKYNLKKKASNLKRDMLATGGSPCKVPQLTEVELKILAILGTTFHEGLNRNESGCNFMSNTPGTKTTLNVEDNQAVASTSNLELYNITNENVEITSDHTYTVPQYGKRNKKDMGSSSELITLSQETLKELKEIKIVLDSNLINLTEAINNLIKAIKEHK